MAGPALAGTGTRRSSPPPRRRAGRPRVGRDRAPAHVEVTDVAVPPLDPVDTEVVQPSHPAHGQPPGLAILVGLGTRTAAAGTRPAAEPQPQVLVRADFLQLAGEAFGERDLVQV